MFPTVINLILFHIVKDLQKVIEYYKNREDELGSRTHIIATGQIIETFMPGRLLSLRGNPLYVDRNANVIHRLFRR